VPMYSLKPRSFNVKSNPQINAPSNDSNHKIEIQKFNQCAFVKPQTIAIPYKIKLIILPMRLLHSQMFRFKVFKTLQQKIS
jgi:hypothetical protein